MLRSERPPMGWMSGCQGKGWGKRGGGGIRLCSEGRTCRQEGAAGDRAAASRAGRKSRRPARDAPGCKQPSKGGCSCSLASRPAPNLRLQLRRAPPLCTNSLADAVGDRAALRPPSSAPHPADVSMMHPWGSRQRTWACVEKMGAQLPQQTSAAGSRISILPWMLRS